MKLSDLIHKLQNIQERYNNAENIYVLSGDYYGISVNVQEIKETDDFNNVNKGDIIVFIEENK